MEPAPLSFLTRHPNMATVGLHQVFDDVEAETGAPGLDRERIENAAKLGKQPVDLALGDADTVVGDSGDKVVVLDLEVNLDVGAGHGVLDGVVDEVEQDLV